MAVMVKVLPLPPMLKHVETLQNPQSACPIVSVVRSTEGTCLQSPQTHDNGTGEKKDTGPAAPDYGLFDQT